MAVFLSRKLWVMRNNTHIIQFWTQKTQTVFWDVTPYSLALIPILHSKPVTSIFAVPERRYQKVSLKIWYLSTNYKVSNLIRFYSSHSST